MVGFDFGDRTMGVAEHDDAPGGISAHAVIDDSDLFVHRIVRAAMADRELAAVHVQIHAIG